jgi:reverse gyrase
MSDESITQLSFCSNCHRAILTEELQKRCPFCHKTLEENSHDIISELVEFYRKSTYLKWEDIQDLLDTLEFLSHANESLAVELGRALLELSRAKDRVEFYRQVMPIK